MPFRSLGLHSSTLKALADTEYTQPTPIQAAAIPLVLERHDLIGIAQTGTGKTAAFVLPLLSLMAQRSSQKEAGARLRKLIIAPTRELVVQIEENVRIYSKHLPFKIAAIYGGVSEKPQIKALQEGVDIVIATPGRLLDLLRGREELFSKMEYLILDEADRMLDMGFIPAIRKIVKVLPRQRQTLFFSATLSSQIERLTKEFLQSPKIVEIGKRSLPADTVTQYAYEISQSLKGSLLSHLLNDPAFKMVLIFSRTKHGANRIARQLEREGIQVATLHSNRSQNQRLKALRDFKEGAVRVLVATDIAARGIDVEGISHVINYDFPMHHEDYIHRIGRTGRAETRGEAISFITPQDQSSVRSLERSTKKTLLRKKAEGFDASKKVTPEPHFSGNKKLRNASHPVYQRQKNAEKRSVKKSDGRHFENNSKNNQKLPKRTRPRRRRFRGFGKKY